jgi:UDP-GlcNAc:undecaprenyl-phosphate/decaprenyl-phosphate GlcNAc-1-phosphate transferase
VSSTLLAFAIALAASMSLTVPARQLALHLGLVDHPGPRKTHLTPMPLLGGVAIYLGVILAIFVSLHPGMWMQIAGILAGATLLMIVGVLDDRGLLHHQIKLFVGMPLAGAILMASGIRAQVLANFWPGALGLFLDGCLTILWVVGITASFSILDHMDGLCAGVAAIAAAYFTLFASLEGQTLVRILAAATFGAALGFLRWNFNPARIFMGDGGAMFLGFLMAALGLKLRPTTMPAATAWMVPALILGATIFDTLLVTISRSRRGLIPFTSPGQDHAAHRLANLGLGRRGAVLALYGLGGLGGVLALVVRSLSIREAQLAGASTALAALLAAAALEFAPYERQ